MGTKLNKNNAKFQKFKLKKGDTVVVLSGKDKGKEGEIINIVPTKSRVVVSGVNVVKKHEKPSFQSQGGIVEKELSVHISNIALADPKTGKATRVGYTTDKNGVKQRVAKKSGEVI